MGHIGNIKIIIIKITLKKTYKTLKKVYINILKLLF